MLLQLSTEHQIQCFLGVLATDPFILKVNSKGHVAFLILNDDDRTSGFNDLLGCALLR